MSSGVGFGTCPGDDGTVLDAIVKLLVADPAQCTRRGLELLVRRALRVRGWLDALEARVAAEADRLAAEGASPDAATLLSGGGRRSRRDAKAAAARGEACARMPELAAALAGGEISAGHVDAVVAAARGLDEGTKSELAARASSLIDAAAHQTPEQLEREAKDLARRLCGDDGLSRQERLRRDRCVRRWVDRDSGMCNTKLSLDPLSDATIWTSINAALAAARTANQRNDERTWDQFQADVVVDLITRQPDTAGTGGDGAGRPIPEVSVLIDYVTLIDGLHDHSVSETADGQPVAVETLRRLCCDADIIPIVLGGAGEPLDVGRHCRVATRAQRRALRAMYSSCAHPHCHVGFETCRIHHVTYWFHGGRSDLDNLIPLCETHHHLVHEGGWTLTLQPNRHTTWTTPNGTIYHDGNATDRHTTTTIPATPQRPHRPPRQRPPNTAAEIADDLGDALTDLRQRRHQPSPTHTSGHREDSRAPPR